MPTATAQGRRACQRVPGLRAGRVLGRQGRDARSTTGHASGGGAREGRCHRRFEIRSRAIRWPWRRGRHTPRESPTGRPSRHRRHLGAPAVPIAGAAQPVTAVGPGPMGRGDAMLVPPGAPPPGSDSPPWPHWRELLEGPDERGPAIRRRECLRSRPRSWTSEALWRDRSSFALQDAIKVAQSAEATPRSFIPWPEADRAALGSDTQANDGEQQGFSARPTTATE